MKAGQDWKSWNDSATPIIPAPAYLQVNNDKLHKGIGSFAFAFVMIQMLSQVIVLILNMFIVLPVC